MKTSGIANAISCKLEYVMLKSNKALIEEVVDRAMPQPLDLLRRTPVRILPEKMRDNGQLDKEGYQKWNPTKSIITDEDIDKFETDIGLTFPESYRVFLKYKHFFELKIWSVRFDAFLPDKQLPKLRELATAFLPDRIIGKGLLPFADEALMDAGVVCIDTNQLDSNGDMPIVYWDHDWIGTSKEVVQIFSSTRKMFECFDIETKFGNSLFYINHDKGEKFEEARRDALNEFLECDSSGALKAREYWDR